MDTLPPELIVQILESLDQNDLRSSSAVSRVFYASAWSAGRYLHRSIRWGDTGSRAAGHEIVPHARKKGLRLSLSIDLEGTGEGNAAAAKGLFPYIDFGHHFPCLRNLDVRYVDGNTDEPPHPATFKLDGVRLRRLLVQDYEPYTFMPTMMRLTDVAAIPSVVHTSDEINWADPFWHRTRDRLSVRLARCVREDGDINVRVVPAHRRWRREYNMFWTLADEFPILRVPALSARLVYLRLENRFITSLLTRNGLEVGALRELSVDFRHPAYPQAQDPVMEMVWPPDSLSRRGGFTSFDEHVDRTGPIFATRSYCTIGCTALQQLTLATCDEGISLASEEIAFLGRALSQCERPATDRAVLVFAGTSMKIPVPQALLDHTFSVVRQHEHAVGISLSERDASLWDDFS